MKNTGYVIKGATDALIHITNNRASFAATVLELLQQIETSPEAFALMDSLTYLVNSVANENDSCFASHEDKLQKRAKKVAAFCAGIDILRDAARKHQSAARDLHDADENLRHLWNVQ